MPNIQKLKQYKALKTAGFLPFEIKEMFNTIRLKPNGQKMTVSPLSSSLTLPYIKNMIKERAKTSRLAKKSGLSRTEFNKIF